MTSQSGATPVVRNKWLFLPPVLVGLTVLFLFIFNTPTVEPTTPAEHARVLRIVKVPKVDFVPRVLGYGTAQPGRVWQAIAEVKGRVISTYPKLTSGMIIKAGTELLNIDPAEYELAVTRLQAEIQQTLAKLDELEQRENNFGKELAIESDSLQLAEQGLARQKSLLGQGAAASAQVEATERTVLAQRRAVQALQSAINLIPSERAALQATSAVKQASLKTAQLDLANTSIKAPFDCRLAEVTLEKGQFLQAGQVLFEAHGTDVTEIEVQVPIEKMNVLLDFNASDRAQFVAAIVAMDMDTIRKMLQFEATVRLHSGDLSANWEGRGESTREFVDPQTRTLGVVIAVDQPYQQVIPGQRPPLVKGMFCEVEMRGRPQPGRVVVPRMSVHDGHVYLVDEQSRLKRHKVKVAFGQASLAVIESGLAGGETLVISDPTPAIEGMLVEPKLDAELEAELSAVATGEGALQ